VSGVDYGGPARALRTLASGAGAALREGTVHCQPSFTAGGVKRASNFGGQAKLIVHRRQVLLDHA
jgi:hypothetical protein